jgi:hypothetical protein
VTDFGQELLLLLLLWFWIGVVAFEADLNSSDLLEVGLVDARDC